jgi:hypothetical protein
VTDLDHVAQIASTCALKLLPLDPPERRGMFATMIDMFGTEIRTWPGLDEGECKFFVNTFIAAVAIRLGDLVKAMDADAGHA